MQALKRQPRLGVWTLLEAAFAATALTAAAGAYALSQAQSVGRIRDVGLIWLSRRIPNFFGFDPTVYAPVAVVKPIALDQSGDLGAFLFPAVAGNLAAALLVCTVVLPWFVLGRLLLPKAELLWGRIVPVCVLTGFLSPELVRRLGSSEIPVAVSGFDVSLLRGAFWCFVLGSVLLVALPRPSMLRALIRGGSIAAVAVLLGGMAWFLTSRPADQAVVLPADGPRAPNILLISIDSLRADSLHCYGYERETSPNIDALAREGTLFEQALAPTSWTLPSHMTLLTGLSPEDHGVIVPRRRLGPEAVTLAEVLRSQGYETAGFVGGPYLDSSYGYLQGFDHYDDYTAVRRMGRPSAEIVTSPLLVGAVEEWLTDWDARGRRRPFFIFLHLWDVHYDYLPPAPLDQRFDPGYDGPITGRDVQSTRAINARMPERDQRHLKALYDGEIRHTDEHLGRLFNALRGLGAWDDTVTVLTADHGEEFFEHGGKTHRETLYDESVRVPLVIRYPPRTPPGRRVRQQVRLMDIAPTLLSLAGLTRPEEFGGRGTRAARDLSVLIGGDEIDAGAAPIAVGHLHDRDYSVRTARHKFVMNRGRRELYDLAQDPGETRNLVDEDPAVAAALEALYEIWMGSEAKSVSEPAEQSPEQLERLRSLGYVQ